MLIRRIARPLLSVAFIGQGVDALRNPKPAADAARPALDGMRKLPDPVGANVPADAETFARVNAAVQIGGGLLLATGKMPRLGVRSAGIHRHSRQPGRAHVLERARPATQGRRTARIHDRPQPARRADHRRGRHRGQALARMARPARGPQGVRSRRPPRCRSARRRVGRSPTVRSPRSWATDCRSARSGDASSRTSPANARLKSPRPPANAQASWPSVARERAPEFAEAARERAAGLADVARERAPEIADVARERRRAGARTGGRPGRLRHATTGQATTPPPELSHAAPASSDGRLSLHHLRGQERR